MTFTPPPPGTPYDWANVAAAVRARPGEWLQVFENDKHSYQVAIRSGSIKALRPADGYETKTANTRWKTDGDKRRRFCTMWVRYNPDLDTRNGATT